MSDTRCSGCEKLIGASNDHCVCDNPNPLPHWDEGGHSAPGTDETGGFDIRQYSPTAPRHRRLQRPAQEAETTRSDNEDETAPAQDEQTMSDVNSLTLSLTNTHPSSNVSEHASVSTQSILPSNGIPNLDEPVPNLEQRGDLNRPRAGTLFGDLIQQLASIFNGGQLLLWRGLTGIGRYLRPLSTIARPIRKMFRRTGDNGAPAQ